MSYSIEPGAIIEYIVESELDNQRLLNTFHYRYSTDAPAQSPGAVLLGDFLDDMEVALNGIPKAIIDSASEDMTILSHRAQVIYPLRYAYLLDGIGDPGARVGTAVPAGVAGCVLRKIDLAGRGKTGRVEIPGALVTDMEEGKWSITYLGLLNTIGNAMIIQRDLGTEIGGLLPIIFNRANPILSELMTSWNAQSTIRYMTRRVVGRGI